MPYGTCHVCGRKWGTCAEVALFEALKENVTLRAALEELVTLSTHYAELLNMHDGGARRGFVNADKWIARLKEIGTIE
jgi:hypothetical protein